ncbi:MAG: EamA family transporter [Bowdeniella nasicola]|nr:EamA family transporter [Bowdeniella nasicola]
MISASSPITRRGVIASVGASTGFALLVWYAAVLAPHFGPWEIFGWRLLLTFPALTVAMLVTKRGPRIVRFVASLFTAWWRLPVLIINSLLAVAQMVLFTWAPGAGRTTEMSLGYFLMPLVMIVIGRVGFHESITRGQAFATVLAALGVLYEIIRTGGLGWPTLVVAIGYPMYFVSRRLARMATSAGLWAEMLIAVPIAAWMVRSPEELAKVTDVKLLAMILGLGVFSAGIMAIYTGAQMLLPFALFGLLSYLEPVLLVLVAFVLLHETITVAELPTYILIWLAVLILALEATWRMKRRKDRHDLWWPDIHTM